MGTIMGKPGGHTSTARHFGRLATTYDHRYRHYSQVTLGRVLEGLTLQDTARVLDVGCGTGELEQLILNRYPTASLVGVDVTLEMLAVAREKFREVPRVTFVAGQAESLPFAPEHFDAVVACNMLHHVRSVETMLSECARVLRPRGRVVLIDWSRDAWHCRLAHYWLRLVKRSYVKMYRASELVERAVPAGLLVENIQRFFVLPYYAMMRVVMVKPQIS